MFYRLFDITGSSEIKNHYFSQFVFLTVCVCLLSNIQATSLGMIEVHSGVNEPFNATIPISSSIDISKLKVILSSNASFNAKGIIREDFLDRLIVKTISQGNKRIEIRSESPIFSSFFIMLLDVQEGNNKSTYSALIDFDGTSPIANLIFNTDIVENTLDNNQDPSQIVIDTEKATEVNSDIKKSQAELASINKDALFDSDLAPEDSTIFKSNLYREILNNSTKPIQDMYVPDDKLSSADAKPSKAVGVYLKQKKENSKIKVEKQAAVKKIKEPVSNNNNSFQIAMGNSSFDNEVHISGYAPNTSKGSLANEFNIKILLASIIGLFIILGSMLYNTYKRRQELKTVYLGGFSENSATNNKETYSKGFHKDLKKMLNNGEFNEATQYFKDELVRRGMSIYEICRYSRTFQEFGISELTTEMFVNDAQKVVDNSKKSLHSEEHKNQTPLHAGDPKNNISPKKNKPSNKNKNPKDKTILYDSLDLSEVADDIMTAKLNLASAYISMGDFVKAQNILNEVSKHGNSQQSKEANRMLKKFNK